MDRPQKSIEKRASYKVRSITMSRLYIGKLPIDVTEDDLQREFSRYGKVDHISFTRLVFNHFSTLKENMIYLLHILLFYSLYSKQTYAFIFYEDSSSSEEAISAMDGRDFMGSIISVKLAKEDTSRDNNNYSFQHSDRERDNTNQPRKNRLMVSNLDPRTSWQDLKGM